MNSVQRDVVDRALLALAARPSRGVLVNMGVGTGKTRTGLALQKEALQRRGICGGFVLAIVPAAVVGQWVDTVALAARSAEGAPSDARAIPWNARSDREISELLAGPEPRRLYFIIVTPDKLWRVVGARRGGGGGTGPPRRGVFVGALLDESHEFANGVVRYEEGKADVFQTRFAGVHEAFRVFLRDEAPRVLLTATPTSNLNKDLLATVLLLFSAGEDGLKVDLRGVDWDTRLDEETQAAIEAQIVVGPLDEVQDPRQVQVRESFSAMSAGELEEYEVLATDAGNKASRYDRACRNFAHRKTEENRKVRDNAFQALLAAIKTLRYFCLCRRRGLEDGASPCDEATPVHRSNLHSDPVCPEGLEEKSEGVDFEDGDESLGVDEESAASVPQGAPQASKLEHLLRELETPDYARERVLVLAEYKEPLVHMKKILEERLPERNVFLYSGGLSECRKKTLLVDFSSSRDGVLLATRKAMRVGVSLNACQRALFLDRGWKDSGEQQALGRIFRPASDEQADGARKGWIVTYLCFESLTVEEWLHDWQRTKTSRLRSGAAAFIKQESVCGEADREVGFRDLGRYSLARGGCVQRHRSEGPADVEPAVHRRMPDKKRKGGDEEEFTSLVLGNKDPAAAPRKELWRDDVEARSEGSSTRPRLNLPANRFVKTISAAPSSAPVLAAWSRQLTRRPPTAVHQAPAVLRGACTII